MAEKCLKRKWICKFRVQQSKNQKKKLCCYFLTQQCAHWAISKIRCKVFICNMKEMFHPGMSAWYFLIERRWGVRMSQSTHLIMFWASIQQTLLDSKLQQVFLFLPQGVSVFASQHRVSRWDLEHARGNHSWSTWHFSTQGWGEGREKGWSSTYNRHRRVKGKH